jgi:alkylation response protein AidB-like acyl-CoA dehydrogenase
LVVAQIDGAASAFIVDRQAKGVTVSEPKAGLGLPALETATVSFKLEYSRPSVDHCLSVYGSKTH